MGFPPGTKVLTGSYMAGVGEFNPPAKCTALTKSGNPCSRNAVTGTEFCKQHTN